MNISFSGKHVLMAAIASLSVGVAVPAMAQASAANGAVSAPASAASLTKAELKAQRKAARKQRRAEKNVQLKKLEATGYAPSTMDPNYPQNLQDAQRKAAATAASQ